ncbi:glycine amidinotransferase [Mytilus galloprovincialis]|nr:glycine amidinotransferase [Mytilus galloprovincialis]
MAVTTVEGVGGTEKGLHPVQRSLVDSHGLQCGFCTPGMVMTMYTLFHNVPQPTADQMERALEGNLCRCTGYRPIIDAFKQASKACPCGLGLCQQSDSTDSSIETRTVTEQNRDPSQSFIFPPELQVKEEYRKSSVVFTKGDYSWYRPGSLSDLLQIKQQHPDACLLMGCTSVGFLLRTGQMKSKTIICGSNVPDLCTVEMTDTEFIIGSAVTMRSLEQALTDKAKGVNENQLRTFDALQDGLRWIGADQIRNMATIGGHIMSQAPNHDLQTLLMAMGAQLNFLYLDKNNTQKSMSCKLDDTFLQNGPGRFGSAEIMTSISIPLTSKCFDAAEVLRLGKDLIVQQSMTANRKGIDWLRRHVKSRGYRVHEVHFPEDMDPVHIDASLVPLVPPTNERKGILITPPDRPMRKDDKDKIFKGSSWEIIDAPFPNSMIVPECCESTAWLSINMLMVGPDKAIVEETELPLINLLESLGIKCIRVPYRDSYIFGGSIHCQTLDVRRNGKRYNYSPNIDSIEN